MQPHFESFSFQHFFTLFIFGLITLLAIQLGKLVEGKRKMWIGYSIASASFAIMVIDIVMRLVTHTFDVYNDLPLFLCDIVALILPVIILTENRKWLGILYFWALAGTLQALVTPDLESGFPTFEFFRYFIMHGGIVTAVVYCIVVWKITISWRDLWNAVIYVQAYLIGIHIFNMMLRSNYSYTMAKPGSTTILNYLGDWPWYILSSELLMVVLFVILLVPFLIFGRKRINRPDFSGGVELEN